MPAFDPKISIDCGAETPPYTGIKILDKNNKVCETTGHPSSNFLIFTSASLNEKLSSEAEPNVRKRSRLDTESDLERMHNENCACLKYLKTEAEVKEIYAAAKQDKTIPKRARKDKMKELATKTIELASEEQTTDDDENTTKGHEDTTEKKKSPALAASHLVHHTVRTFPLNDEDIACLAVGNKLKDSIIDFYLNYIHYEVIPAEYQERTHIFSSFFSVFISTAFQQKNTKRNWFDLEKRMNKWIKNVEIFSKDFIFIPVNKAEHWYLAVICYLSQLNKNSHEEISVESKESSEYDSRSRRKKNYTYPKNGKPCICFFDSLCLYAENKKKIAEENLKEFFKTLWTNKNPHNPYDWDSIPVFKAVCPQQNNAVDCGLYLLQYVESFFMNPIPNLGNSEPLLQNWFSTTIITYKRDQIMKVILEVKGKKEKAACSPSSSH